MTYPDPAFAHAVAGLHIGGMFPKPMTGEFGAVLTVGAEPGVVEDDIRHRHIPISYLHPDPDTFEAAADWAEDQLIAERTVLVRSEGGKQRPGLVIALVILNLGGSYFDAVNSVRKARLAALTDFRFLDLLKAADERRKSSRASLHRSGPVP